MKIITSQRAALVLSAVLGATGMLSLSHAAGHSAAAEPIIKVMPAYPRIAWVDRIEGNVQVRFNVNAQGIVENIRIVRASHPVFETNVMDAVSRFRYGPIARRGMTETFRFTLEGSEVDPEPVVTASES